jgi:hypothetical protein
MKRRDISITTGVAVLAMQATFLIALHVIRRMPPHALPRL